MLSTCFNCIIEQTLKPKEVILAISESNNDTKNDLYQKHKDIFFTNNISFKIVNSTNKHFPGFNRIMGANIAEGDIFVFIDSDDIIHPKKLEITKYLFDKYSLDGMLHSFVEIHNIQEYKFKDINYEDNLEFFTRDQIFSIVYPNFVKRNRYKESVRGAYRYISFPKVITFGYLSIKKKVFKKVKYENLKRGEDTLFLRDCLFEKFNMMYFNLPLLNYFP